MVKQVLKLHKFTQESPTSLFSKVIESHSPAQQILCYYNSSSKLCLSSGYQFRICCIQVIESHFSAQQILWYYNSSSKLCLSSGDQIRIYLYSRVIVEYHSLTKYV